MLKMGNVKSWTRMTLVAAAVASVVGCGNNDTTTPILAVDPYLENCTVTVGGVLAAPTPTIGLYLYDGAAGTQDIIATGCKDSLTGAILPKLQSNNGAVVSPITSMISILGGGATAEEKVRKILGIGASVNLNADPVTDKELAKASATMTAVMESVRQAVSSTAMTGEQVSAFVNTVFTNLVVKAAAAPDSEAELKKPATFEFAISEAAKALPTASSSIGDALKLKAASLASFTSVVFETIKAVNVTGSTAQAIADISKVVKAIVVTNDISKIDSKAKLETEAAKIFIVPVTPVNPAAPATGTGTGSVSG